MTPCQQIAAMLVILAAQEAVETDGRCLESLRSALRLWEAAATGIAANDVASDEPARSR